MSSEFGYVTSNIVSGYGNNDVSFQSTYLDLISNFTTPPYNDTDSQFLYDPCDPNMDNKYFNCTREKYLLFTRGPQMLQLPLVMSVTILYVGTFIAGIVGNVIVCMVIIRHSSMHTATNYYLFNLAVSDLIYLLFGLPYDLSLYWHQYPYVLGLAFCKLRALISEASTYVSVLTIVAFSTERFLAICYPLHLYAMSGFKRAVRIIATLWIISFLSAVPFGLYSTIHYIDYPPDNTTIEESAFCAMLDNPPGFPLWELSSLIFFAIPMVVMIVLYARMGLQIRFRSKHASVLGVQQGSMHNETKQVQSRKAIIRMLAAVVITFFVCWAPFHAQRLMYLHAQDWPHYQVVNTWLFSVAGLFYYFSCTINPILYNVMSHRYRVAFRETLCGRKKSYFNAHNGLSRDAQYSVRETLVSTSGAYDINHSVRVRSVRQARFIDREGKNTWGKKLLLKENIKEESHSSEHPASDMVVVIGNNVNGRPKCFTTSTAASTGLAAAGSGNGAGAGIGTTNAASSAINHLVVDNADDNVSPSTTPSSDKNETCI